jgi:outer membrane protein OmpA-like peptidoglycan-associated protein
MSVYKWLGVEADIQAGSSKAQRAPFESIGYRPFHGLATVTVPLGSSQKANLVLGGGYALQVYSGRATANVYEDGFTGLAGLKLCTGNRWGLRVDGLYDANPSPNEQGLTGTSRHLGIRAGMSYALRGACGAGTPFDWALRIDPASATVNRGADRPYALGAADASQRPIELRKVMNLTCSSSDAGVATVDNMAKVAAVKAGTATITCKGLVKGIERSASATVTVPPAAWTFALTPANGTTEVGKTLGFTAKAVDSDNVDLGAATWASENAAIATVASGTVTCRAAGTTTITASKTAYGSTKSATATATCTAPPPASIALQGTLFNFDRAVVLPMGQDTLKTVLAAMQRVPSLRISIEGHTDRYGPATYNAKLADTRAQAVRKELLRLAGKDAAGLEGRISVVGWGEQCLITTAGADEAEPPPSGRGRVANSDKAAQAENRRVEVWQLLDGQSAPTSCRSADQRANRIPFSSLR